VTFNLTVTTAGAYTMHIYSVISSGTGTRTAEVTVNGASVSTGNYPEGCLVKKDIVITLRAGANQIKFANQNVRGPSLDRIEITKP